MSKKLLLFSDLHADSWAAERLVQLAAEVDILVGAGDFGNARRRIGISIEVLRAVDKPAVLVPGNAESAEELTAACQIWPSATVLHGNGAIVDGLRFFGIGGGIPVTPFGPWSYDFTEEEATVLLSDCESCDVLVSHSPPFGTVDLSSRVKQLGSTAVLAAVERLRPQLVVCGHIHESAGKQVKIVETLVVNAGPRGVVVEVLNGLQLY